jgi:hypothetical protein
MNSLLSRASHQKSAAGAALRRAEQAVASAREALNYSATASYQAAHADGHAEDAVRSAHQSALAAESLGARAGEFAGLCSQQTETCGRASLEFGEILDNLRGFDSGGQWS